MLIIRFGYCSPNPGPKARLNCKWYSDKESAIQNWNNERIFISVNNSKYREITINELVRL